MEAKLLHHLGVPCISAVKTICAQTSTDDQIYYVNSDAVFRHEPNGATITPPTFYSSFISIDRELADLLKCKKVQGKLLDACTLKTLLDNGVLLKKEPEKSNFRETFFKVDNLPVQVLLDVTSACNCNCITCYHQNDLSGYTPPLKDIHATINRLVSLGLNLFEVTGGEPTLREDLPDILMHLKETGSLYYLVTNGAYLGRASKELITALKHGLGLAISLDGVGDVHDWVRRCPGLYVKLLEGMERAAHEGIKIYLISTLNQENVHCVPEMIALAERFNTTVHLRPTIRTGAAILNDLTTRHLVDTLRPYLDNPFVRNGLLSTKKTIPNAKYYGCGIRKRISVSANGFLFPCVMDRNQRLENIHHYDEQSLIDALSKETRLFLAAHHHCTNCDFNTQLGYTACGGFCRFSKSHREETI